MATIGRLIVQIGANLDDLKKGVKGAQGIIGNAASKLGGFGKNILGGAIVGGAGAALAGVTALGVGIGTVGSASFDLSQSIQQSQNDIVASLGVTQDRAEELGDVAVNVWKNNFTGSVEEATASVVEARKQLGDLSDSELQDATENALRLADSFETDLTGSLNSAGTLIERFELSEKQAFDLLASGLQRGLNNSDDFLDSIGEYSNIFDDAGFSADQMFSIMESGLAGGVLGTDKIADAIKEMNIRLNEGSSDVSDAFGAIGLDFERIQASVAAGDENWSEYFDQIIQGINSIEDPIARGQAQVAIFGTMAEDLGPSFTEGLSASLVSLEDMAGATDALNAKYDNFGSLVTGMWREMLVAVEPVTGALLDLANDAMPIVRDIFDRAKPIFQAFGSELSEKIKPALLIIFDAFNRISQALGITNDQVSGADRLLQGLEITLNLIITSVETAAVTMHLLAGAVEATSKFVSDGIEGWKRFGASLDDLELPDWLTPGSPTPLELGLKGITAAFKQVPDINATFGAAPALAAGGAGGGNTAIVNVDGVSATSVTNSDPADEAIRLMVQLLRQRLKGSQ